MPKYERLFRLTPVPGHGKMLDSPHWESLYLFSVVYSSWLKAKKSFETRCSEACLAESTLIRSVFEKMRAPDETGPAPGFCERVVGRIEVIQGQSIWIPLITSRAPKRLAMACFGLSLILLGYVFAAERSFDAAPYVVNDRIFGLVSMAPDLPQQRDAVLVQFAAYGRQSAR